MMISMGVEVSADLVVSTLLVSAAVHEDAGLYSCTLPVFSNKDLPRASVVVHVILGETTFLATGFKSHLALTTDFTKNS